MNKENLKKYCEYINNTGQRPLSVAIFDEDLEPIGLKVRADLVAAGLVDQWEGALMLTDDGEVLIGLTGQ